MDREQPIELFAIYDVEMSWHDSPIVYCDDWTMPVDEIWRSYVVFPKEDRRWISMN